MRASRLVRWPVAMSACKKRVAGQLASIWRIARAASARTAQGGVQDDAGGVDHPAVIRPHRVADALPGPAHDHAADGRLVGLAVGQFQQVRAGLFDRGTHALDHDRPRDRGDALGDGLILE